MRLHTDDPAWSKTVMLLSRKLSLNARVVLCAVALSFRCANERTQLSMDARAWFTEDQECAEMMLLS